MLGALEEMNSREVGLAMGIPEGTVRTRMMRARAELKRSFEGDNGCGRERSGAMTETNDFDGMLDDVLRGVTSASAPEGLVERVSG